MLLYFQAISESTANVLQKLKGKVAVGLVSGSDLSKIAEQMACSEEEGNNEQRDNPGSLCVNFCFIHIKYNFKPQFAMTNQCLL